MRARPVCSENGVGDVDFVEGDRVGKSAVLRLAQGDTVSGVVAVGCERDDKWGIVVAQEFCPFQDCEQNLSNVKKYLAHNKNVTTVPISNVNHLLLPCKKGTQDEYKDIKEPVSEEVLQTIVKWLKTNHIIK